MRGLDGVTPTSSSVDLPFNPFVEPCLTQDRDLGDAVREQLGTTRDSPRDALKQCLMQFFFLTHSSFVPLSSIVPSYSFLFTCSLANLFHLLCFTTDLKCMLLGAGV